VGVLGRLRESRLEWTMQVVYGASRWRWVSFGVPSGIGIWPRDSCELRGAECQPGSVYTETSVAVHCRAVRE
jgi:hypothetical protein